MIVYSELGDSRALLALENYYILSISMMSSADQAEYSTDEEEQNEAFETIRELLYDLDEPPEEEAEEDTMSAYTPGPRRLELTLERAGSNHRRQFVVVKAFPPSNTIKDYGLVGRYRGVDGNLEYACTGGISSAVWNIVKIQEFRSNTSSSVITHHGTDKHRQSKAWRKVVEFYDKMSSGESKVIEKWDEDEPDTHYVYGNYNPYQGSYYSRTPEAYKPLIGEVRVAGDEIGAKIYLEQAEAAVKLDQELQGRTIQEYLEEVDSRQKKSPEAPPAQATGKSRTNTGTTPAQDSQSGGSRVRNSSTCSNCGSPACSGCLDCDDNEDFWQGTWGPYISGMMH